MHVTSESDYALRIMYALSNFDPVTNSPKVTKASDISRTTGVTIRFAMKILRKLTLAGIVDSKKGSSGGYFLAKNIEDISLGEIIETIEGQIRITSCTQDDYDCPRAISQTDPCRFHHIFCDLTNSIRDQFYSIKLSDVLSEQITAL